MAGEVDLGIADLEQAEKIGFGGFAVVYKAWDRGFRRWVAVKVLQSLDAHGQRAFDRERGLMGQLDRSHNIVTPYSAGYLADGSPYVVMEYLPGGSLQDRVERDGPLAVGAAVDMISPIAEALGEAHAAGVIHRDVKPANILLSDDETPKLTDFGIGTVREATVMTPATATQIAYTMAHSPPETFSTGQDARDERSDLYSLASTLYTLVTGRTPFESETETDSQLAFMRRIEAHPVPSTGHGALDDFIGTAMAKDPEDRYPTAALFAEALQKVTADPTGLRPAETAESGGESAAGGATTVAAQPDGGGVDPASQETRLAPRPR